MWDLLNACIFGEQDDDDNENENSKSSSAADRNTNGHTYKATKRKLLSVEYDINMDDSSHVQHDHHTPHSHDSKTQGLKKTVEDASEANANAEGVQGDAERIGPETTKQEKNSNIFSEVFNVIMKVIDDILLYW